MILFYTSLLYNKKENNGANHNGRGIRKNRYEYILLKSGLRMLFVSTIHIGGGGTLRKLVTYKLFYYFKNHDESKKIKINMVKLFTH